MRQLLLIASILLFTSACLTFADESGTDANSNSSGVSFGKGKKHSGNHSGPKSNKKDTSEIKGRCNLIANDKNPFAGACIEIQLVLNDENDKEVGRARTDKAGSFSFGELNDQTKYRILSASRFYEVISPQSLVKGGDHANVTIQRK